MHFNICFRPVININNKELYCPHYMQQNITRNVFSWTFLLKIQPKKFQFVVLPALQGSSTYKKNPLAFNLVSLVCLQNQNQRS